ncbi:MAG: hypothetical protein J6L77_05585 [Coprococcus sp.]|nr:hypothetical protein [Coprococcus sp.]
MVNGEKVILMTKLAMYEQSLGREDLDKGKYFKSDYVKYNCLKTLVSTTVLFWVIVAAYVYYNLGTIMEELASMDYLSVAYKLILYYGLVCLAFLVFAWVLYSYRYIKAKPKLIKYNQNLKKLIDFYDKKDKTKRPARKRRTR